MCPTAEQERGATTSSESNLRPSTASGAPVAVLRPDGLGGSREEKQAERDISWQELTHAHRIARLGTWTWVRATGAVVNSPELYAIYGIDPGQMVDLFADGERLYSTDSWQRLRVAAGLTFDTGDPFELDMEIVHPGAESAWVIVSGEVAARTPGGEISELRGTVQEITARKHTDQELTRSEARYRSLLRISPSIIWSTGDPSGEQVIPLPEWQAFTGQTDAQMLGTGWADAVHPDDLAASDAAWKLAVRTGTTFKRQERIRRRDGVYRTMQVRAVPSRDAEGNILEWVGMHTDITDRLAAEADAGLAHEKLESMLTGMTDGLAIRDNEGRYTYMSERAAQILGVDRKAVIGKLYWEVFPTARHSEVEVQTRRALETRQPVHFEQYVGDPVNKWLEYHYYPTDEGLSIYVRDITERKEIEETLARTVEDARRVTASLEAVLTGMTDGLCIVDRKWRLTYLNEQGARVLGLPAEGLLGRGIWELFPPAETSAFGLACHQAVDTGLPVHVTDHLTAPQEKWVESHCYPSVEGLSIYFRDITADKLAEAAIAHSEAATRKVNETLKGVLDGMTDGLNVVDTDWRYTYLNEQAALLLGVRVEDMLGKRLWDMFPRADEVSFGLKMREAVASGKTTHTLDFYPEPINKWLDCHFYPSSEGLSIYFHDVTAKLQAEEALQSKEKLATAGLLAASIAAEIKAPLEAAGNLLALSLQMTLPDPVRANLIRVEQEVARVARATTQTLRFHRHSTTIPTSADMCVLLDSALDICAPRFTAAGINVERDYVSQTRLFCYGDEVRQVFANLLSNALEATPRGGTVRLRVRPSPFFDGIRVTIADTGHGVPAELQSRIFDLFVSTKEDSGAGLGLWVSEGVMRKHKGRISMHSRTASPDSDIPSGTVFAIQLPYIGVEPNLASKAASRRLPQPTPAVA